MGNCTAEFNRIGRLSAILLCLVMSWMMVLPITARAQDTPRIVRVGWYESPFNRMDARGRRSGYAYEYQQKIAAYTGWTCEYVDGSWPELYQMLVDGEIDLMSDVSYTPDRAKQMLFPNPAMGAEEYYIFIAPDNTQIRQDDPRTLNGKRIGAMDFIPKPYPDIEIVKARIAKCIESSEDRELIRYTERDRLTDLLNKGYFIRYVSRLDHLYKDAVLDAVVCDVSRFHSVNKQYGRQFGDQVLRSLGGGLKRLARETGGIVCREAGNTFLLYGPHQENYEHMFRGFLSEIPDGKETAGRVRIRFGVFADARQEPDIEERFDRAKIAADRVEDDPEKVCGFYELS